MSGNASGGVILIMLGVLTLYLIWKTDVVARIVGGAGSIQTNPNPSGPSLPKH